MSPGEYILIASGPLLEALILLRGWQERLWRRYPFFYAYLAAVFTRTIGLFILLQIGYPLFARVYWPSDAAIVLLRFFIPWEVFRQTFASLPPVRRLVAQAMAIVSLVLAAALFWASEGGKSLVVDLERKAGFAQAALLVTAVLLARYYSVPLGRNVRGMALGFGIYVSVAVMNFATFDLLGEPFSLFWRYIRPLSFVGMLGVWAWALWFYAPNPQPATASREDSEHSLAQWKRAWRGVGAVLRKTVGL